MLYIFWNYGHNCSFLGIFCFFLDDSFDGWSQSMWLVPWRRQVILTQGPAPDPKGEFNITSFLTLPHPLYCPICARNIMVTVLLLQMMGEWEGWGGGSFMLGFGWGDRGWISYFFHFLFCFYAVVNCSFMVCTWLLCLFHCSFFAFFVSGPFN